MSSDSKFFLGVVVVAVLAIAGIILFAKHNSSNDKIVDVETATGQSVGLENAPITIVEFGDFQCPFCADAASPLRQAQKKNADKVRLVFRNFPLVNNHKYAEISAYAAQAAAKQGKFWEMYDLLYANQAAWTASGNAQQDFLNYAQNLDLDVQKFKNDLNSDEIKNIVKNDLNYALDTLKLDQTPTFFVNGKRYVGVLSEKQWQDAIDEASAA